MCLMCLSYQTFARNLEKVYQLAIAYNLVAVRERGEYWGVGDAWNKRLITFRFYQKRCRELA